MRYIGSVSMQSWFRDKLSETSTKGAQKKNVFAYKKQQTDYKHTYQYLACHNVDIRYRQDAAKRQTAGIVFTHRPKIRFFAPQGRIVAPIQVKLFSTDGHLGPLGCAKFHVNRCRRVGMRPPKYQKNSTFW